MRGEVQVKCRFKVKGSEELLLVQRNDTSCGLHDHTDLALGECVFRENGNIKGVVESAKCVGECTSVLTNSTPAPFLCPS